VTGSYKHRQSSRKTGLSFLAWVILLLFVACEGRAALGAAADSGALSAAEMAKRVNDHYNHLQSLKASFTEQYDGLGMHRSEAGVMLLRKPGRMRWEYKSTAGKVFVLDGKYAWFYTPGDTQVQRIAASQLDDLRSPLRFLLGHTKIESELEGLKLAAGSSGGYTLTGVPKGQQKRIAKLSIKVTETGVITGIEIDEVDGAQTRFTFSDEMPNAQIPESEFHFTPPAGVPVVDALPPV
jgi:outer membrane lipoprotein carrier protein